MPLQRACGAERQPRNKLSNEPLMAQSKVCCFFCDCLAILHTACSPSIRKTSILYISIRSKLYLLYPQDNYKFPSRKIRMLSIGIRHSRPTFTAGSSSFWIILRICWRVVLSSWAASFTVSISLNPMGHASPRPRRPKDHDADARFGIRYCRRSGHCAAPCR